MKLKIEIKMNNAAFFDDDGLNSARNAESARILRELAATLDHSSEMDPKEGWASCGHGLRDVNGNLVGELRVTR